MESEEKTHSCDPEDKSSNGGRQEFDLLSPVEFSMDPIKEEGPSSVWRVRLPS